MGGYKSYFVPYDNLKTNSIHLKILVISTNYPSKSHPQKGTFVYELIQNFVKEGNEVTVISPKKIEFKVKVNNNNYGNELAKVYYPNYISFSNKRVFGLNSYSISKWFKVRAVRNVVLKNNLQFDILYAHFISSAFIALEALRDFDKPVYVAVGEYRGIDIVKSYYSKNTYNRHINRIKGFIAVSPQIKSKLISLGINRNQIIVEPNSVNLSQFKQMDKRRAREKYCLPYDKKLVLFIGRFIESKGPLRVLKALELLPENILGVFIGIGPQLPVGKKVAFIGKLPHHEIPEIMNAADIFVLPTLHEGSSNVIIEAMACGLPIVSSDLPEIKVQCTEDFSILVNPMDIKAIAEAINFLVSDNKKLHKFSFSSTLHAKNFNLEERANRILRFIQQQ